jgi:hypothetical protein
MTGRDGAEMRVLRAELLETHRDLVRVRTQAEQLIVSNHDLSSLLASASRQAGELLKVSVAIRRLSDAVDAAGVMWALEDVAINVVGTENFVILACGATSTVMHPIGGMGPAFDEARQRPPSFAQLRQSGDRVIPLYFGGSVVGALVIRRLLDHRTPLTPADEQVLALLAHFGASAIVACEEGSHWSREERLAS